MSWEPTDELVEELKDCIDFLEDSWSVPGSDRMDAINNVLIAAVASGELVLRSSAPLNRTAWLTVAADGPIPEGWQEVGKGHIGEAGDHDICGDCVNLYIIHPPETDDD